MTGLPLALLLALAGGEEVRILLPGGVVVEGVAARPEPGALVVTTAQGAVEIPADLVVTWWVDGRERPPETLQAELDAWLVRLAPPGPTPPPWACVLASAALGGGGQALLGQRGRALAYAGVDLALLGVGALVVGTEGRWQPAVPVFATAGLFRAWSAIEARRDARRARRWLAAPGGGAGPPQEGAG